MDVRRRDQDYREADVLSATPERLVVLLYEKMVRDLGEARSAALDGDVAMAIDRAHHSQLIVSELAQALDSGPDPDLAADLSSLYDYLLHEHLAFMADRDVAHLDDCLRVIGPLADAWRDAAGAPPEESPVRAVERSPHLFTVSA